MQTKNIIQSSARVIRITELAKGNVIKFIDEQYSVNEMRYAIVSDILNDGSKMFIELISFKKDYGSGIRLERKMIAGDKDVAIFPAKKEDLMTSFTDIREEAEREIVKKERELADMKENLMWLTDKIETHKAQELTEPKFEELQEPVQIQK